MLPSSLTKSLKALSHSQLIEVLELVDELLAERESPPSPPDRNVVEKRDMGAVVYQLELVKCGKKCKKCPHGPYWYAYYREGGRQISKYIGKEFKRLL